ncbi:FRITZ protein, partial [Probosciger aterrimus]|nr:FRITZ protein [Probosciger aterrimus]
ICHQMSFCLTEMFLWSLKTNLHIKDEDIGIHQYYDKKEPDGYLEEKQKLAESRDYPWILKNKRSDKLRDTLKEVEDLMQNSQCVLSKWKNKHICQLLFHSGILVSLSLSGPQLEKVVIDRTLVGKLISDTISDAVLTDSFIILSFEDHNQLCFIQFTKKMDSPDVNKRLEKLSCLDFKISYIDILGPEGRRMKRHLAVNCMQDTVICWWSATSDGAWPWSPISCERDRANLLLLGCAHGKLEVKSTLLFFSPPLWGFLTTASRKHSFPLAIFSTFMFLGRQAGSQCRDLEAFPANCQLVNLIGLSPWALFLNQLGSELAVTSFSQAGCLEAHHPGEVKHPNGKMLTSTAESYHILKFILYNYCKISSRRKAKLSFSPSLPLCSPLCKNLLSHLLFYITLSLVLIFLVKGVFTRGQLGLVEIIHQYIRYDEIHEAINVLNTMNWNTMGRQCYICLSAIVNHLLKQRLTPDREAQLEASLGTFYAPTRPLLDTTVLEYRDPISRYARRFFHHLLRYQRFEKAFLLAVDLGARDLFMDIHYLALDKGELALAEVAKKKANDIDAESITTRIEFLGQSDEEDPSREAFIDRSSEHGGEHNPP